MLHKDYDNCIELMAFSNSVAKTNNTEAIKVQLEELRGLLVQNFGDQLEYTFASAEKKWTTRKGESTPPNSTKVLVQFNNDKEFGIFQVYFDDFSKKINSIKPLDVKRPIPKMTFFWLFGLIAICGPLFNVYMIMRVKKSQFKKKWKKYLAIIILNVPAISYNVVSGFSVSLLNFQILLGISFDYTGYLNTAWTIGIPLGGLFILRQLRNGKDIPAAEIPDAENDIPLAAEHISFDTPGTEKNQD
jgi:hypothetical protein